jgi:hypothetical protein
LIGQPCSAVGITAKLGDSVAEDLDFFGFGHGINGLGLELGTEENEEESVA